MNLTFPRLCIIFILIGIFMIAGLYWWVFFGTLRFDVQNAQIEKLEEKQLSILTQMQSTLNKTASSTGAAR